MIWLHTYSGLVLGWLLFAIFVTGTLSYFNKEISQWMKPELLESSSFSEQYINHSLEELAVHGAGAQRWRIYLPNERTNHGYIQWGAGRDASKLTLNHFESSPIKSRNTKGGNFFLTFHYSLQLREYGGRYLTGIAAMFMLVAMFSGLFTHRRFFRDFFTLRTRKSKQLLIDFHALFGIITIPFCLMICISAIMIYVTMYMPWSAEHYYQGGQKEHRQQYTPKIPSLSDLSPLAEPLKDFGKIQQQVNLYWPGGDQIARITIEKPYQENGRIIIDRVKTLSLSNQAQRLVFSSVTGNQLQGYSEPSTAATVRRIFYGLHQATFAGTGLRWLFFFLGAVSSALIATGLIIWLNSRLNRIKQRHLGHHIVERLNIAAMTGLLLAILSYFYANRILPLALEQRANIEVQVFFCVWFLALCHSVIKTPDKAWSEQLLIAAFCCLSLPLVDFYQDSQRVFVAIQNWNVDYLAIHCILLINGVIFMKLGYWLRQKAQHQVTVENTKASPC